MPGIYVHIPFCRQACTYCDFYFTTNLSGRKAFTDALIQEAHIHSRRSLDGAKKSGSEGPPRALSGKPVPADRRGKGTQEPTTLYYGGGTPTLLENSNLTRLTETLRKLFVPTPDAEFTIECNPDDLDTEKLKTLRHVGVNRLSIGVQSFIDEHLALMNRSHNSASASDSIKAAQDSGFTNLTIDLIYGIPGMTMTQWEENIGRVIDSGAPHISAYALTVEDRTQLAVQVKKGTVTMPPDEAAFAQYEKLISMLTAAGIEQYELSNFARPGFRSRHNSAYWKGTPYLGLGPSAHSFDGQKRWWNKANHTLYAKDLQAGILPIQEEETLTPNIRLNEYLMTHLRTLEGIDPQYLRDQFHFDIEKEESENLTRFIREGLMFRTSSNHYILTTRGLFLSDSIIRDLFHV